MTAPNRDLKIAAVSAFDRLDGLLSPLRRASAPQMPPKRILFWTVDRIGDVLRSSMALGTLARAFPQAEITAVIANRAGAVMQHSPHIHRYVAIPKPHDLKDHWAALRQLQGQAYDLGVIAEVEPIWAKLGQLVFRRLGVSRWARFELGLAPHPREALVPLDPGKGWDLLFADLAAALGADTPPPRPELFLNPDDRSGAAQILTDHGIAPGQGYILCHPGTSALVIDRSWPAEKFGAVLAALQSQTGLPAIITGLPAEKPLAQAAIKAAGQIFGSALPLDMTGKLSLGQLMAAIDGARLMLVNDTGPMHIANALSTPTVAILGPTAPHVLGTDPSTTRLVHQALECQPCAFHGGLQACSNPVAYDCLKQVSIDQVTRAAQELLEVGQP
ncbi:MAG: glycosyltransferase family 9 protein [Mangrovicoccus sp.]